MIIERLRKLPSDRNCLVLDLYTTQNGLQHQESGPINIPRLQVYADVDLLVEMRLNNSKDVPHFVELYEHPTTKEYSLHLSKVPNVFSDYSKLVFKADATGNHNNGDVSFNLYTNQHSSSPYLHDYYYQIAKIGLESLSFDSLFSLPGGIG